MIMVGGYILTVHIIKGYHLWRAFTSENQINNRC